VCLVVGTIVLTDMFRTVRKLDLRVCMHMIAQVYLSDRHFVKGAHMSGYLVPTVVSVDCRPLALTCCLCAGFVPCDWFTIVTSFDLASLMVPYF